MCAYDTQMHATCEKFKKIFKKLSTHTYPQKIWTSKSKMQCNKNTQSVFIQISLNYIKSCPLFITISTRYPQFIHIVILWKTFSKILRIKNSHKSGVENKICSLFFHENLHNFYLKITDENKTSVFYNLLTSEGNKSYGKDIIRDYKVMGQNPKKNSKEDE